MQVLIQIQIGTMFIISIIVTIIMMITRYRSISGQCNNLDNPHWGAAMNR